MKHYSIFLSVPVLLLAGALLRPHEDTFTALDHSGYRWMGKAFAAGRGFHEKDGALTRVPADLRKAFMLLPRMEERNTRDRSFLVHDLEACETEPFFYPLLPVCAVGFDRVLPGDAYDYFVPVCGVLLLLMMAWTGWRAGGPLGTILALALFFGSPVPAWCFRGFYPESAGAALTGLVALDWLSGNTGRVRAVGGGLALGLAIGFHPIFIVVALPLLALRLFTAPTFYLRALALASFGVGLLPLWISTQWIAAPYGRISLANLVYNFKASASHRLATLFGIGGAVGLVLLLLAPAHRIEAVWRRRSPRVRATLVAAACLAALIPIGLALGSWSQQAHVAEGLRELWVGIRWPFGLLLGASALYVLVRGDGRSRTLLGVAVAVSPIFLYLKGAEHMALWSQRRLLPLLVLAFVALLPAGAAALRDGMNRVDIRWRRGLGAALSAVLLLAGFANAARWPAPYWTRVERGADAWVERVRKDLGDRLTVFDYYPFSLPFAVDNRSPFLGLGEYSAGKWSQVADWLCQEAQTGTVQLVTAYANPGVEDGFRLVPVTSWTGQFPRVRAKTVLPAEAYVRDLSMACLRVEPFGAGEKPPPLRKILDGGPVALRGYWGRKDIQLKMADGSRLDAMWSREGCGVVGPVPPVGKSVEIALVAGSGRKGKPQTLLLHAPWSDPAAEGVPVVLDEKGSEQRVRIAREGSSFGRSTGVYRFTAREPYDPGSEGIDGFDPDLGALVHSISIVVME